VRPLFLLTDLITDQAEYELLQRKRHVAEWCELPEAQDSPPSPPPQAAEFPELGRLVHQLSDETRPTVPLTEVVPWGSFEESAYRLSMLSLLGDAEAAASGGLVARLAALPYALAVEAAETVVGRAGVARMNGGQLHHLPRTLPEQSPAAEGAMLVPSPATGGPTSVPSPVMGQGQGGGEHEAVASAAESSPPVREEAAEATAEEPHYVT
jgi:hypothetical protein